MNEKKTTRKIKTIDELEFKDDFMFSRVMENESICKRVIETILDIEIDKISYTNTQETIKFAYDEKGIRLDVILKDEEDVTYAIEMQVAKERNIGKRSKYYHSVIDMTSIEKGQEYEKLPNTFVIFICDYDPFGYGECIYKFSMRDEKNKDLKLDTGGSTIIVNTRGSKESLNEELGE